MSILVVDDEHIALKSVKRLLLWEGYNKIETCGNGREAVDLIKNNDFDVVLLDILMPEMDGMEVLKETKPFKPFTEFIMFTAVDDLNTAVDAVRIGAYDYLVKPVDSDRLLLAIKHAYERKGLLTGFVKTGATKEEEIEISPAFSSIITRNKKMKELLSFTEVMARSGNPVLITGESGTGKELLAHGVHLAGPSPDGPFVAVNVSSVPETMFESQFFGHKKGAFTGAAYDHKGLFEQANGGTLFLDEIGELPLSLQTKFLRILEEKIVTPIGSKTPVQLNVRIVSATNRNLDEACKDESFRMDLLYRLKAAHVHLPPLRERTDDVSAQVVENAVLVCESVKISPEDLGEKSHEVSNSIRTLCTFKEDYDRHLAFVLEHTNGDRQKAAEILGVTVRQIHRKLARLKT